MWTDRRISNASGFLAPGFEALGDAFAQNFAEGLELGAMLAVFIDGAPAVNLRGGFVDKDQTCAWADDTIACYYSSSKAVLAFLTARAVSEGRLDYDTPVARYWPEFSQNGKASITVGQVMSHQAGLCGFSEEAPQNIWLDAPAVIVRIEKMAPLWPPGTKSGYHPQTYGFIVSELLRRTGGRSVGEILREDYQHRDGLRLYCGLGEDEMRRTAFMPKPPRPPDLGALNEYKKIAFLKRWSMPGRLAREDWMAAEIPASNMHGDAYSLAAIVSPLANQGRDGAGEAVLSKDVVEQALATRCSGDDLVLPFHIAWSAGLMRNTNRHFSLNENAYGQAGSGGSSVLVDPQNRLCAAYVMTKMSPHLVGDPRFIRLMDALYAAL